MLVLGTGESICRPAVSAADAGAAAKPELHEFTSTDGKTFKGQIQSMTADIVTLKREDGQVFKVKPDIFIPADQKFIQAWMVLQTKAKKDTAFNIILQPERTEATAIPTAQTGITTTQWTEGYALQLKNQLPFTWNKLTVRYIMFKAAVDAHVESGSRPTAAELMGKFVVSELKPGTVIKASTAKATMRQLSLPPGSHFVSGAPRISADQLRGLWVRIYDSNDQLIYEWSSAGTATRDLPWDSIWADQPISENP